jgi:hypothetical protein
MKGTAMNREHLTDEASMVAAYRITERVATLLREEEQTVFLLKSYAIIRAAIEAHSIAIQREQLNPSSN